MIVHIVFIISLHSTRGCSASLSRLSLIDESSLNSSNGGDMLF